MSVTLDRLGDPLIELPDLPRGKATPVSDQPSWGARAIAADIISQIRAGSLTSGQALPSRRNLAELYQVSETTIFRALQLLAFAGWVRGHQGRDVRVADQSPKAPPR
jgi:GntR family transcriptional regulator